MKIEDITEDLLLRDAQIRKVDFEYQNYFAISDLNNKFMGAFHNVPAVPLPLLSNGQREFVGCVSFEEIMHRVSKMSQMNDFDKSIFTALNFNPKKGN